jgi:hypothetical protein
MISLSRQELMLELAKLRCQLAKHGIRDSSDYAEVIVSEALNGERIPSGVNQGYDVTTLKYGRVEVKCRMLPQDGRIEERVDLRDTKANGFDHLAIVVFFPDYSVKGAVLIPYNQVWPIVESRPYHRISYGEACQLDEAIDITELVSAVAQR